MTRQTATKERIVNATEKLLKNQEIGEIAVTDVCRLSGVSRTTFYTYFQDIFAVVQWVWDGICDRSIYKIGDGLSWYDGHLALFTLLLERKPFFTRAFADNDRNSVMEYGYRISLDRHIANSVKKLGKPLSADEMLLLDYSVKCFSAMTTKWVREGMLVEPRRMAEMLDRVVPEFLR